MKWKLLNSRLQTVYENQFCSCFGSLFGWRFWFKLKSYSKVFPQTSCFPIIELVEFELLSQTTWTFVTEVFPLELFSQKLFRHQGTWTFWIFFSESKYWPLDKIKDLIINFFPWPCDDCEEWGKVWQLLSWVCEWTFPFVFRRISRSFYSFYIWWQVTNKTCKIFFTYIFCTAPVKLTHSVRSIQNLFFSEIDTQMFSSIAARSFKVIAVEGKLEEAAWCGSERVVLLENLFVVLVPKFQQSLKLKWSMRWPKNTLQQ